LGCRTSAWSHNLEHPFDRTYNQRVVQHTSQEAKLLFQLLTLQPIERGLRVDLNRREQVKFVGNGYILDPR
jgi:hypothetical protein